MNITKTGILNTQLIEPYITLSDGSKWQLLLYHQVDNGTRLFTSANCGYCNDFGLFSRLQQIDSFVYNNKYEFYVIQDGVEHRWTQTNAPWTTTAVTGFTLITGTVRSGVCKNSNHGALAISSITPWWNCCGSYASYSQDGASGIPGFGPASAAGICQNYLALYARISTPIAFLENTTISGNQIYEY